MNTQYGTSENAKDLAQRLAFFRNMQALTAKMAASEGLDQITQDLQEDICALFHAERLTIYVIASDNKSLTAKIKAGLSDLKELRLPINSKSLAGYVAATREIINIADAYDDDELATIDPELRHLREVDRRTHFRTREVLVGPIVDPDTDILVGVIQLINNRDGGQFSQSMVDGLRGLCAPLGAAIAHAAPEMLELRTKYDFLVADGLLSREDMDAVLHQAREEHLDIEEVLINVYGLNSATIGEALAKYFGVPYEPFQQTRIRDPELYRNLKRDYILSKHWLPLDDSPKGLRIICLDPEQVAGSRAVSQIFPDSRPLYLVTTVRDFNSTLDQMMGAGQHIGIATQVIPRAGPAAKPKSGGGASAPPSYLNSSVEELIQALEETAGDTDIEDDEYAESAAEDNELVRLVNKIIIDSYNQGVSDIHIEPGMGKSRVLIRIRKDGSLVKYAEVPASYRNALVARLKVMCDLDISERRKPQDGKIKFKKFGPLDIELRVATLPTTGGVEDVVMRILAAGEPIPLDKLGVLPKNLERLKSCISKPYGLFFVCGPTGSGKTTTLHSVLKFLNTPDTKIWTAEDPVEITQAGLRQCQINKKAGLDFPVIMKAFLRADPDIIMVGEMRDADTTGIGIEASLTGHLVFATLHTNSAPESIIRLLDMGMDPFNFADALLGILAQRLAKRLCGKCKEAYTPDAAEIEQFMTEYCSELQNTEAFKQDANAARERLLARLLHDYGTNGNFSFFRAKGCAACDNTGYKGRVGLHELMVGTDPVKKLIQEHARVAQLFAQALEDGMLTLKMDGMEKVMQGITDIKQVRAVCIK